MIYKTYTDYLKNNRDSVFDRAVKEEYHEALLALSIEMCLGKVDPRAFQNRVMNLIQITIDKLADQHGITIESKAGMDVYDNAAWSAKRKEKPTLII